MNSKFTILSETAGLNPVSIRVTDHLSKQSELVSLIRFLHDLQTQHVSISSANPALAGRIRDSTIK